MDFTPPESYTAYAFLEKGGKLQPMEVAWKEPDAGYIVAKVLACGVCYSDTAVETGTFDMKYPRVPGHEIVGRVVAVPASEAVLKPGQLIVSGWHGGHDNTCNACRSGDFVGCANGMINGINRDGAYAEYVTLRSEAVVVAPEGIEPAEIAPLCCAGVTLFTAMRNMNARPGDLVAIQGIGGLGHVGLQFARAMGFRTVALSSGNSKRELALELGADEYINVSEEDAVAALQARGGAHLIVCTVPNADKLGALARGLVVGGTLLLLGLEGALTVPAELLVTHRLSLRGWPVGTPQDLTETIEFAKLRGIRSMVQKFPLEKAQEAYDHLATARFRAVIVPGA